MDDRDKDRKKKIVLVLLFLLLMGGMFYFFLNQEENKSAGLPRPNLGEVTQAQPETNIPPTTDGIPQATPPADSLPQEAMPLQAELPPPPAITEPEIPPPPQPPVQMGSELNSQGKERIAPRQTKKAQRPRAEKSTLSKTGLDTSELAGSWKPAPTDTSISSSKTSSGSDSEDETDDDEQDSETTDVSEELIPKPIADAERGTEKPSGTAEDLEQSELAEDNVLDKATDEEVEAEQKKAETLLAQNENSSDKPVETEETIDEGGRKEPLLADNQSTSSETSSDDPDPDDSNPDIAAEAASAVAASQEDWVGDFHADAVHILPMVQIGQLTALPSFTTVTDTVNAASNFGVGFDWSRRWSKRIQTEVHAQYLSYKYTAGTRTLTEATGGLFAGGLAASYFVKKGFDISIRLRFSQELFYRANTLTAATLDQALLVFAGLGAGYSIFLTPQDQIRFFGSVDFGLPNRINNYSINTFMNYQIRAGYETDSLGFHLGADVGFRMDDVSTSIGTQVWTGFEGRLKAGMSF
ncbi:MAG: hypothetical protein K2X47_02685 [Bdellovibrionales bacterium]|nr:hypothetical protein [Bdellovibrionales bacterium]